MVKKEIKSVVKLRNVAQELKNDLMQETSHYTSGYGVVVNVGKDFAEVDFLSSNVCEIITEPAFNSVMDVVKMYIMMYDGIDWHLGVVRRAGTRKYYPVVRVCIKRRK